MYINIKRTITLLCILFVSSSRCNNFFYSNVPANDGASIPIASQSPPTWPITGTQLSPAQLPSTPIQNPSGNTLSGKCLGPRGQFPTNACDRYVNCWDGVVIEETCPAELLFSLKGYCDFPSNVECRGRPISGPQPVNPILQPSPTGPSFVQNPSFPSNQFINVQPTLPSNTTNTPTYPSNPFFQQPLNPGTIIPSPVNPVQPTNPINSLLPQNPSNPFLPAGQPSNPGIPILPQPPSTINPIIQPINPSNPFLQPGQPPKPVNPILPQPPSTINPILQPINPTNPFFPPNQPSKPVIPILPQPPSTVNPILQPTIPSNPFFPSNQPSKPTNPIFPQPPAIVNPIIQPINPTNPFLPATEPVKPINSVLPQPPSTLNPILQPVNPPVNLDVNQPNKPINSVISSQVPIQSTSPPRPGITVDAELNKYCLKPRGQFPTKSCNKYVNCWDGLVIEETCPDGLLFSVKGYCDFPYNVECQDRSTINIIQASKECPSAFGTFRDGVDCSGFFTCSFGKVVAKYKCPTGYSYSINLGLCDLTERVACDKSFDPQTNFFKHIPSEFMSRIDNCSPGSVIPLNSKCSTACLCGEKYSEIIQCPIGLAYDSASNKCLPPHIAKCSFSYL